MQRMGSSETTDVSLMEAGANSTVRAQVSVLMAIHGDPIWLRAALDSLFEQTFKFWECICVLDGPNDEAERILSEFGPRVKYEVSPIKVGAAEARNRAMRAAGSELLAVLDSDDVWPADHLAAHFAAMIRDPELVLRGTSAELIDAHGESLGVRRVVHENRLADRLLMRNVFIHSSTMFRRDVALSVGGYDGSMETLEDLHLWLRIAQQGKIENDSSRSIRYRIHDGQVSRVRSSAYSLGQVRRERLSLAQHLGIGRLRARVMAASWEIYERTPRSWRRKFLRRV